MCDSDFDFNQLSDYEQSPKRKSSSPKLNSKTGREPSQSTVEMINQLKKTRKPVAESNIDFPSGVGKKRTQNEAYLEDLLSARKNNPKKK